MLILALEKTMMMSQSLLIVDAEVESWMRWWVQVFPVGRPSGGFVQSADAVSPKHVSVIHVGNTWNVETKELSCTWNELWYYAYILRDGKGLQGFGWITVRTWVTRFYGYHICFSGRGATLGLNLFPRIDYEQSKCDKPRNTVFGPKF